MQCTKRVLATNLWVLIATLVLPAHLTAQEPDHEIQVGFWNVENLFDADDDPKNPGDDEYLPDKGWDQARYERKLENLANVVLALDCEVLGVCEVENRRVLEDLVKHDKLSALGYEIAHLDSPDKRGIDVALLYRAPVKPQNEKFFELHPFPINPPTRGVLEVRLELHGQPFTVLVNHWPSRGGGDKAKTFRMIAANVCRQVITRTIDKSPNQDADILLVGDLNDDPYDESVLSGLDAVRSRNAVLHRQKNGRYRMFNPSWKFLGQTDMGTLYYNREWVWNVFDQCILSRGMLKPEGVSFVDGSLEIYGPDELRDQYRRPLRFRKTGKKWTEGYSDHLAIRAKLRANPAGATKSEAPK